jgi:chromosome segregation ATPase
MLRGGSLGVKREEVLTWAKTTVAKNGVIKEGNAVPNVTDQQTYDFDAIKKALEVVTQCDRGDRDGDPRQEPREVALAHNFLLYAHAVWTQEQNAKGHLIEKKPTKDLVLANEAAGRDFKRPRCRLKSDAAEGIKRGRLLASIEGRPTLVSFQKETSGLLTTIEKLKAEQSMLTAASESELSTKTARIKALETQLADESAKFASMAQSLSAAGEEKAAAAVAQAQESIAAATEKYKSDMAKAKGMAESRQTALEEELTKLEKTNAGTAAERGKLQSTIEQKRKLLSLAESQFSDLQESSDKEIRTLRAALAEATERGESASASASASAAAKSQCEVIVKQKDAELERLRKQISDQLKSMASDMASKDNAHRGEIRKIQADLKQLQKFADSASAQSSKAEAELETSKAAFEDAQAALKSLERKAASNAEIANKCRWELSAGRKLWESQTAAAAEKLAACQENLRKATEQLEGNRKTSSLTMKAFINISALLKQTWYLPSSLIAAIKEELEPLF